LLTDPPAAEAEVAETGDDPAGVMVLAGDGTIELADAPARRWLAELTGGTGSDGDSPSVLVAVARRASQAATGHALGPVAAARIRTPSGRWLFVRG
jgi:hypothetical protein